MFKLKTLKQINVKNKSVLLRIDINSPVVNGKVLDNPRFKAVFSTIKYLIKKNAKITILTHQGRKGDKDFTSLKQHAKILSKYVKRKILYIDDLFGNKVRQTIMNLKTGQAILLKNVRYYDDEININNPKNKYKKFCKLFDLYINEAFSVSHRNHGSIVIPPRYLPSLIGLEFEKEILTIEKFKKEDEKSKLFILAGAKIEDYIPLFKFLKNKKNKIIAGGVLANLIITVKGYNLGQETIFIKEKYQNIMSKIRKIYNTYKNQIIIPVDFTLNFYNKQLKVSLDEFPFKYKIYDAGPQTINLIKNQINSTRYILMKGTMGFAEFPQFATATIKILRHIAHLTKHKNLFSIIAGGHLTTTIEEYHIPNNFSHTSTAGGALIKYLSGEKLPGIKALESSTK